MTFFFFCRVAANVAAFATLSARRLAGNLQARRRNAHSADSVGTELAGCYVMHNHSEGDFHMSKQNYPLQLAIK